MSFSKECQEYHLTPRGWVEGSFYGDAIGGKNILVAPDDRVLTIGCFDELPAVYVQPHFYDQVLWRSKNKTVIAKVHSKYGERPNWFGYAKCGPEGP